MLVKLKGSEITFVIFKQFIEIVYFFHDKFSVVGIFDHDTMLFRFDKLGVGYDVDIFGECFFDAFKGLVSLYAKPVRVIYKCLACNTCFSVVIFAETAVYDEKSAVCLDRLFAA